MERDRVAISPARSEANIFVDNFSDCFRRAGFTVDEFSWKAVPKAGTVIFHWPNEFFIGGGVTHGAKCLMKLAFMRGCRAILGTRFVWVAHNTRPHDAAAASPAILSAFLGSIDGIVFLSRFSRAAIADSYALPANVKALETVHGDYRNNMAQPSRPQSPITSAVRLVTVGQIRPYKNLDRLVAAVARVPASDVRLTVAGTGQDGELVREITRLAAETDNVTLDIRSGFIPEIDLERHVDEAHAVVLSYRNILNSGAALLALSRNRPVLAPRIGSLPELQEQVGEQWLHLYDGDIDEAVLREFAEWMRRRDPATTCDLSRFGWDRVGEDLTGFVRELHRA